MLCLHHNRHHLCLYRLRYARHSYLPILSQIPTLSEVSCGMLGYIMWLWLCGASCFWLQHGSDQADFHFCYVTHELCLYLDEERSNAACGHCGNPLITRDDGDGSSSSTNADEPSGPPHHPPHLPPPPPPPAPPSQHSTTTTTGTNNTLARSPSRERLLEDTLNRQRSPMNEQVVAYIRSLEARVMLLEAERQQMTKPDRSHPEGQGGDNANIPPTSGHHPAFPSLNQNPGTNPMDSKSRPPHPPPYSLSHHLRAVGLGLTRAPLGPGSAESDDDLLDGPPPLVSRPNSVAAAMRVLEVQEQLEAPPQPPPAPPPPPSAGAGGRQDAGLADGEKALLRQMCSVVWKKLEEVPTQNR
ncbi:hypothetical protein Pcinc_022828 [Petrolisthes cinctipes]|uniref:Uncharacterized protein n=1 Tax=Petrolisthes cinctipes TaxID=88211 RepID=A0AAE1FDF2_PETCI|nr:hypothetical protein Pcinc_022828 [Petrolisthes cinctipes]